LSSKSAIGLPDWLKLAQHLTTGLAIVGASSLITAPLLAQDDASVTRGVTAAQDAQPAEDELDDEPEREIIDLTVTVPRGEVNPAQVKECEDRADAAILTGEIVVCREIGEDPANLYSGSREERQKRYAEETAFSGSPRTPEAFGIPNHGNPIGFGSVPPPALIIDVEALPEAPEGSDADRVGQGLAPIGRELTEEEEKARREAQGIRTTAPPRN